MVMSVRVVVLESVLVYSQVSEAGVHRPHVAGIHGRENEGAYSIVLSGGYEDDKVNILMTGYLPMLTAPLL